MDCLAIKEKYEMAVQTPGNIQEHLPVLLELATECESVVEAGIGNVVSTWAFLLGCGCRGGSVVSYDKRYNRHIQDTRHLCKRAGVRWTVYISDWMRLSVPHADMLFIDTLHTYKQLQIELRHKAISADRYIVLHDTTTYGDVSEGGSTPGLWAAVEEFLAERHYWRLRTRYENCNGLTILELVL